MSYPYFLFGFIFLIAGFLLKIYPLLKINSFYGYRSHLSMKNQGTWNEGNKTAATILMTGGFILMMQTVLFVFVFPTANKPAVALLLFTILAISILTFTLTQIHLKRLFDNDGKRKEN